MNSLNFARSKHSPLNKGRQEGIFYKTLITNPSPFERRRKLGEIVKNPPTPFIKGEMYSFPSPLTGEGTKGGGFKKKFHSIPSPLGRGLGRGFTLVELIVVVTILAILGTIAFISLQGYTQEARDSKRISDTRSLITKITIENAKGTSYSEIMNEGGTGTSLTINGTSQTGTQNKDEPINWEILKENAENFRDPLTKRPYPFAYAVGNAGNVGYDFMQLAYVSEKTGLTKLMGNYYEMLPLDSPSLFIGCIADEDEEIEENGCPIYDLGIPYIPANCETENSEEGYTIPAKNHGEKTDWLEKNIDNGKLKVQYKCRNGNFRLIDSEIECDEAYSENGNECIFTGISCNGKYWYRPSGFYKWNIYSTSAFVYPLWDSSSRNTNYGRNFNITNYPAFVVCANLGELWRLPTLNELETVYDYCKAPLSITNGIYWSSKESESYGSYAYYLSMDDKNSATTAKSSDVYVVCVKD